ncbi:prephenate dehydrogenase [Nakamurella endophytica]|uniref:Prephenate dehydrogenase n=1 Tax=Nakamurella endophytica TaxID=1748367 RepID=A0A917SQL0_9ACTN|nr:prephenate dehydrogenase [Nakamurella endophytica]GGL89846.1 prephenate dehydrogenase [Nakamurella endophytica]
MSEATPLFVVGLGLIGGSLVRAATGHRAVTGWSPSEETRAAAARDGVAVADSLDGLLSTAADRDGLVVLAAPTTAFPQLLARVNAMAPTVRLTDVGSVKAPVQELAERLAPRTRFIGGHPMAGTASSGWEAGSAELFRGAAWVTTLTEDSDLDVWAEVATLAIEAGSRVVPAEPEAHDRSVARVSHLPHLLALALAQVGAEGGPLDLALAASSFADGTRVAGTRPDLIRAMCEGNREALVSAMDDALGILGVARGSLASTGSLQRITAAGHQGRADFDSREAGLEPAELSGEDMVEQLLAVGSSGGHVVSVDRDADGGVVARAFVALED